MKHKHYNKVEDESSLTRTKRLTAKFYQGDDVVLIAKELLGKILVTRFDSIVTAGRIVETEAYNGVIDKASHAYGNRRTNRTEVMYNKGGVAYVYLCYGIHQLFNIVTNKKNIPHAILIRALEPVSGVNEMLVRTGKTKLDNTLTRGPGNVSKALGISTLHSGVSLFRGSIYLLDDGKKYATDEIGVSPRIGVAYAGADALLPYRFYVKNNPYVSGKVK